MLEAVVDKRQSHHKVHSVDVLELSIRSHELPQRKWECIYISVTTRKLLLRRIMWYDQKLQNSY